MLSDSREKRKKGVQLDSTVSSSFLYRISSIAYDSGLVSLVNKPKGHFIKEKGETKNPTVFGQLEGESFGIVLHISKTDSLAGCRFFFQLRHTEQGTAFFVAWNSGKLSIEEAAAHMVQYSFVASTLSLGVDGMPLKSLQDYLHCSCDFYREF